MISWYEKPEHSAKHRQMHDKMGILVSATAGCVI